MPKVTINMIAEKTGVSRGTVDRVLHNRSDVSPEVRERILAAAKVMGYIEEPENNGKERVIGVILPGNRWFDDYLKKEWMRGVTDAKAIVEPLGYKVTIAECETDLSNDIIAHLEKFRKDKAAGIVMTAMDTGTVRKEVDSLVEAGIPVVTYNSDIGDCKRACFIGQDLYRSGKVAANMIRRNVDRGDKILAVAGNLEYSAHEQRIRGFVDGCREGGIREDQILIKESHNEYYLTYSIVGSAVKNDPDIKIVYMANESIAACAEALASEAAGRNIMVIGNDLTGVTRKLLAEHAVEYIIEQNIYWQGYQPVITIKKLIEMPEYPLQEKAFASISIVNAESIRPL